MKKADFIVLILALILIAGVYFFSNTIKAEGQGEEVAVFIDKRQVESFSLYKDETYNFNSKYGVNTIEIKDGKASVKEADCRNKHCVHSTPISKVGESIVCLPHRFYIEIIGKETGGLDAVAK